jgi:hypothetical protein
MGIPYPNKEKKELECGVERKRRRSRTSKE